jgi:hypothetical protein
MPVSSMLLPLSYYNQIQRMEENGISKNVLYMNLETTRLRENQEIDGKMK